MEYIIKSKIYYYKDNLVGNTNTNYDLSYKETEDIDFSICKSGTLLCLNKSCML